MMQVEIWSDVVCPWCYIGKRRFERALADFAARDQVVVVWRSYQLDPQSPREAGATVVEHLTHRYGTSLAQAAATIEQVSELAAQEGLTYHLDRARRTNTFDAHRLLHFAAQHGRQDALKERLLHAYFTEGAVVSDAATLLQLAVEVGLPTAEASAVLASTTHSDAVRADEQRARDLGIQGVPFFVVAEKYGVSGAQPAAVFKSVLERAWAEAHPPLTLVATTGGDACEGEDCAL